MFAAHADTMLGSLCILMAALTCVDAAKVLTQTPAALTVSAGQEAVLRCNVQIDYTYVSWYKQIPGGVPQYILYFYHSSSSPTYGSGFSSDRFNSKTTSTIDYQLIIKRSEAGDSAVYYCGTWDGSANEAVFGGGTKLTVTSSSVSPPVLTVFPPSDSELQANKASLVCLSRQSVPYAEVTWLAAGTPVSSGVSTSTAVQQADHSFHLSSHLALQTADWNSNKVYVCKVSLGSRTAETSISKSSCPN